jgi:transcriptional regulator with XRE-family HTH domain
MDQSISWRELLGRSIGDVHERQRIATALGINPATLTRWAANETNPRQQNLRELIRALPQQRKELIQLIQLEFPEFEADSKVLDQEDSLTTIPAAFYSRVLDSFVTTRRSQRFWTVCNLVLNQALGQLDPNSLGMAITVAQCLPPSQGGKVRSMREVTGRGTPPWQFTLTREALFLGIESLAGYAITKGRTFTVENRMNRLGFYPVRWEPWEESAVVSPIWFEYRIAGCLVVSSTQANYFLPFRQNLIEQYAKLMTLAFEPEDFFKQEDIQLMIMPDRELQQTKVSNFRQRLSSVLLEVGRNQQTIDIEQSELLVWQQLEEEFLELLVQTSSE